MLREDLDRPHHVLISWQRQEIATSKLYSKEVREKDMKEFSIAAEAYIRAKTDFSTVNSDRTMKNLNGTYARLTRRVMEMDDKYGTRR